MESKVLTNYRQTLVDQVLNIQLNQCIQGSFGVGFLGFRPVLGFRERATFFLLSESNLTDHNYSHGS